VTEIKPALVFPKKISKNIGAEKIALYNGSDITIMKEDLVKIWTPKPALYAARLTKVIMGEKQLEQAMRQNTGDGILQALDQHKLKAIRSECRKLGAV
jgi:hypothetical protein